MVQDEELYRYAFDIMKNLGFADALAAKCAEEIRVWTCCETEKLPRDLYMYEETYQKIFRDLKRHEYDDITAARCAVNLCKDLICGREEKNEYS